MQYPIGGAGVIGASNRERWPIPIELRWKKRKRESDGRKLGESLYM